MQCNKNGKESAKAFAEWGLELRDFLLLLIKNESKVGNPRLTVKMA
jgi:hypothetical protein